VAAPVPAAPAKEPEAQKPIYEVDIPEMLALSDEDQAVISQYEKDWPDQAAAMKVALAEQRRQIMADVLPHFNSMATNLQPIVQTTQQTATETLVNTVLAAHADAETLKKDGSIKTWIESQPAILQPAYNNALSAGSAKDVIAVFDAYRVATPAQVAAAPAAAPAVVDQSELERQVDVPASSSPAPKGVGVDKNDFETAFKQATAAG
jgi:hypothetical protein